MKRESFTAGGIRIETWTDYNGRHFTAWKPHVSVYCQTRKDLLRFAAWPTKTPTGDSLRSWLDSLEASDIQRKAPIVEQDDALLKATGFGPECHDVDNDSTRMIT
jgi:hypothetical protein